MGIHVIRISPPPAHRNRPGRTNSRPSPASNSLIEPGQATARLVARPSTDLPQPVRTCDVVPHKRRLWPTVQSPRRSDSSLRGSFRGHRGFRPEVAQFRHDFIGRRQTLLLADPGQLLLSEPEHRSVLVFSVICSGRLLHVKGSQPPCPPAVNFPAQIDSQDRNGRKRSPHPEANCEGLRQAERRGQSPPQRSRGPPRLNQNQEQEQKSGQKKPRRRTTRPSQTA